MKQLFRVRSLAPCFRRLRAGAKRRCHSWPLGRCWRAVLGRQAGRDKRRVNPRDLGSLRGCGHHNRGRAGSSIPAAKGQRHNRPHARGRHQPARGRAGASECVEAPLDRLELLGEHRAGFEERLGDRAQRIVLSHQIRTRPSKVLGVVGPTFRPKPRSTPRRLISISWRLACRSLRVVRSARTSLGGQ